MGRITDLYWSFQIWRIKRRIRRRWKHADFRIEVGTGLENESI